MMWSGLEQRLLPTDKWFGLVETPHFASRNEESGAGVVTGSIHGRAGGDSKTGEQPRSSDSVSAPAAP